MFSNERPAIAARVGMVEASHLCEHAGRHHPNLVGGSHSTLAPEP